NAHHIEQNVDVFDFELTAHELASVAAIDRDRSSFRVPRALLKTVTRLAPVRQLP
ncbi:MAG: aldo/keto reductase, partial [Cellulomonadaceae bacterium]|nr:aldo/keto reductase [Cellulomonadaceae bacterium]